MLPGPLGNYLEKDVMNMCEEEGNVCPHWMNDKIYLDLGFLDKSDGGTRAMDYLNRCHRICVSYISYTNEIKISCHPYDFRSGETCTYKNDSVSEKLKKHLMENGIVFMEGTDE